MTIQRVNNTMYNLQTFLGDSGTVTISNLPTDSDAYVLYMEINGKQTVTKTKPLNGEASVDVDISVQDTTNLGIGQWPYGVKLANGDEEDTYIPDLRVSPQALFIVNKKAVEGPTNE